MEPIVFRYQFQLSDERQESFELVLDSHTLEPAEQALTSPPEWARLNFKQCTHCPLRSNTHPYCPVAISLVPVVELFNNVRSYEEIELQVDTQERRISQHTSAQRGLSSLLGLLIATSGCPHTNYLKPMARFHLPLASEEETLFRAVSMYLLAQYLRERSGLSHEAGLQGLKGIYDNLHQLNQKIAERLRYAADQDSAVNAVVILDMFTNLMPFSIDEDLEEIGSIFDCYLDQPS
ncbi:MAG: hypothetical protein V7677_02780 [Motiliproteus sp.]